MCDKEILKAAFKDKGNCAAKHPVTKNIFFLSLFGGRDNLRPF